MMRGNTKHESSPLQSKHEKKKKDVEDVGTSVKRLHEKGFLEHMAHRVRLAGTGSTNSNWDYLVPGRKTERGDLERSFRLGLVMA